MKVKELIKKLKQLDPNAEVVYSNCDTAEGDYSGEVHSVVEASESLCEREGVDNPKLLIVIRG
ncbi:hypothetical protein [Endozoicomonas sp. SESOKO3]|uniref:hypothetical protein n=1 Tax=Endozoicomonas sp. SESOKO3 TaxID=2828744 RepID=UPI002147EFEF|nr:hypothetical protein [Endozoicomonas sp. SESOKO3]